MERSSKHHRRTRGPWECSHAHSRTDRSGKIALVTLIAILGLLVLAGFVGNAGHIVITKVKSQNAADAIAFSSAQWMARGMNAVTATNHMLGEATALAVVIEGLGGPEADLGMEAYPPQSQITDTLNQNFISLAKIQGLPVYGAQAAGKVDAQFLDAIVNKLVSPKDTKHHAFATIYDSKLSLKKSTAKRLIVKSIANAGLYVPPPWGWLTAIPAYAVHIGMNFELAKIGVEYVILEGLERLVISKPIRVLKVNVIEEKLIPALAAHGDYLAGRPSLIAKKRPKADSSVVNYAIRQSLEHLGEVYHVDAVIYPTALTLEIPGVASIDKLRLPIAPEAAPSMAGTTKAQLQKEWGDDKIEVKEDGDPIAEIKSKMAQNRKRTEDRIKQLQEERYMPLRAIKSVLDQGPERARALVELEDRILDSALVGERTRTSAAEVEKRYGMPRDVLDRLAELEVLSPNTRGYSPSDIRIIEAISRFRAGGYDEEIGFTVYDTLRYKSAIEELVKQEVEMVMDRLAGEVSPERVVEMLEAGAQPLQDLIAALHTKLMVAELERHRTGRG